MKQEVLNLGLSLLILFIFVLARFSYWHLIKLPRTHLH